MRVLCAVLSLFWLINLSVQDRGLEGRSKPSVNFYGTLVTHAGKEYNVEHITIGGAIRQIPVYESPNGIGDEKEVYNPKDVIRPLDLVEIKSISVPDPQKVLTFVDDGGEDKYVALVVTYKNGISRTYLINEYIKILCDEVIGDISGEMTILIPAVKLLRIEGYTELKKKPMKKDKQEEKATIPA